MRNDQEVEELVHANLGLVGKVVNRTLRLFPYLPSIYDRDDLHSVGSLGLLSAAQTFDPARGVAFSTYAYGCIEHAIVGALKRERTRQIECISLSLMSGDEDDNPLEEQLADPDADPASSALHRFTRATLESAVGTLPERQARVINALYFEGDSVGQVATRSRLSMQAVQNLHVMGLKALRRRLHGLGLRASEV
jgi:RNA polymerase sporulation-specific sigma factor